MSSQEPIYTYERTGFSLTVYPNRIEVLKAGFVAARPETIILRTISSVEVKRFTGRLVIHTTDGKKHDYIIGVEAEEARQAILGAL